MLTTAVRWYCMEAVNGRGGTFRFPARLSENHEIDSLIAKSTISLANADWSKEFRAIIEIGCAPRRTFPEYCSFF